MESRIMYIELKTGYTDDGPAWIGLVEFSKTKRTAYFNGKAFKHAGKGYFGDVETKENYWISGVKKNGEDRHRFGKGKIMIDKNIINEYLSIVDFDELKSNKFELVEIEKTDISKFNKLVNEKIPTSYDYYTLKEKEIHKLTADELEFLIDFCSEKEENSVYNKPRRSIKKYRIELEAEVERRKK